MKFLVILALAVAVAVASPTPKNIISYVDENGNVQTEDLDEPVVAPLAADINKQKFYLFTPSNKDTGYELKKGDAALLKKSGFDPKLPTKFAVHGWQSDYTSESVQDIKNAYLSVGKYNVIICDYKEYNSPYLSAVSNAKNVGNNIGSFIQFLIEQGMPKNSYHLLGHSLGAHVSGFAGQYLISAGYKPPRITGLDAAGPMFNGKDASGRLSSDDADYVDCLHTSTEFGMTNRCGTADFYPNGGSKQPSCAHASMSGGCDHAASHRYFASSVSNAKTFPAHACASESEAQAVERALSVCKAGNIYMGDSSINGNPTGSYFVAV